MTPFPCSACGKCCRRVNLSEQTASLDRGDGICRHLDTQTNLCTIYHERPLIYQVEAYYKKYLSEQISWQDFAQINMEICQKL